MKNKGAGTRGSAISLFRLQTKTQLSFLTLCQKIGYSLYKNIERRKRRWLAFCIQLFFGIEWYSREISDKLILMSNSFFSPEGQRVFLNFIMKTYFVHRKYFFDIFLQAAFCYFCCLPLHNVNCALPSETFCFVSL